MDESEERSVLPWNVVECEVASNRNTQVNSIFTSVQYLSHLLLLREGSEIHCDAAAPEEDSVSDSDPRASHLI